LDGLIISLCDILYFGLSLTSVHFFLKSLIQEERETRKVMQLNDGEAEEINGMVIHIFWFWFGYS
jgi:hypothetical protein